MDIPDKTLLQDGRANRLIQGDMAFSGAETYESKTAMGTSTGFVNLGYNSQIAGHSVQTTLSYYKLSGTQSRSCKYYAIYLQKLMLSIRKKSLRPLEGTTLQKYTKAPLFPSQQSLPSEETS